MPSPLAKRIDAFLKAKGSPLAGHGDQIVAAAQKYYRRDPGLLARLIVGISGGEQSYGTTGNQDVTRYHNVWGYGHPPSGLTSTGMFNSWGQSIDTVAKALGQNYLGQGLTRPEQLYGRWVKGDEVSTAARGGYSAPWISTVTDTMRQLGGAVGSPAAPAPAPPAAPPRSSAPRAAAPPAFTAPPPIDFAPYLLQQLGRPNYSLQPLMDFVSMQQQLQIPPASPKTPEPVYVPKPVDTKPTKKQGVPSGKAAKFGYPLGKTGAVIGTPYSGTHTLGNWQSDNAIDIAVPVGTPVYATSDGTIGSRIGSLGRGGQFAGLRLTLEGGSNSFYYAHLSRLNVKAGQRVRKGQLLGYSGEANGVAHLHIGIERGDPRKVLL